MAFKSSAFQCKISRIGVVGILSQAVWCICGLFFTNALFGLQIIFPLRIKYKPKTKTLRMFPFRTSELCSFSILMPFPSSAETIECLTNLFSYWYQDVALLDRLIKDDVEFGKLPLLLVANAGKCCGQAITKTPKLFQEYICNKKIKIYCSKQLSGCISRNIRKYLNDHTIIICPKGILFN